MERICPSFGRLTRTSATGNARANAAADALSSESSAMRMRSTSKWRWNDATVSPSRSKRPQLVSTVANLLGSILYFIGPDACATAGNAPGLVAQLGEGKHGETDGRDP